MIFIYLSVLAVVITILYFCVRRAYYDCARESIDSLKKLHTQAKNLGFEDSMETISKHIVELKNDKFLPFLNKRK